jgi:transcriptional regulator with XRE-family HTH domain
LDFSYISKVENGRVPPPAADTIVKICAVLNVPTEGLLALAGKLPSEVQQTMGTSSQAQRFLAEAQKLGLSDTEWDTLTKSLRRLRDEA